MDTTKLFPKGPVVADLAYMYSPQYFREKIGANLPEHIYEILSIEAKIKDPEEKRQLISEIWYQQRIYDEMLLAEFQHRLENPEFYQPEKQVDDITEVKEIGQ